MRTPQCTRFIAFSLLLSLLPLALFANPRFASRFTVERMGKSTLLTITDAYPGAAGARFLFVPRGAPVPPVAADDVIHTPVRRVVSLSTTNISHFEDLDAIDTIVAVDSGAYVYSPQVRRRIDSGQVIEVGSPPSTDIERIITAAPDLVLVSVVAPEDPTVERLRRAGVPVVTVADWREGTPLGRAEWILVAGLALDREAEAEGVFRERAEAYRALARRAADVPERPEVLVNAPYRGTWSVPQGDTYVAQIIADAGGDYLWRDSPGTGSLFLDIEEVVSRGAAADVWINLGFGWRGRADAAAADPRFAALRAFRSNAMFNNDRRMGASGGNDYWESGVSRPDLVLADLISIFHPHLVPDHRRVYYRRLDP